MYKDARCFEEEPAMMNTFADGKCAPVYEKPCERVSHREINHVIEHVQPINIRVVNHHVYHHTYIPCYTCMEENEVCHVYDCNPCTKR